MTRGQGSSVFHPPYDIGLDFSIVIHPGTQNIVSIIPEVSALPASGLLASLLAHDVPKREFVAAVRPNRDVEGMIVATILHKHVSGHIYRPRDAWRRDPVRFIILRITTSISLPQIQPWDPLGITSMTGTKITSITGRKAGLI